MALRSINPFTGEVIREYEETSSSEAGLLISSADSTFLKWREQSFHARAEKLKKAALILHERKNEYALLMAKEMGKPVLQGRAEAEKCAWACEYYAENGEKFLSPEIVPTDAEKSFVAFEPIGVLLAIMPWNFPFWQVFRASAPALMAGNAVILKHSSNVSGCALAIEKIFKDAGFGGLFCAVFMDGSRALELIENPLIRAVTLTGSTSAGKAVAEKAGRFLKKTVLELGGSDAYVVLEDADIKQAAEICVKSRLINNGQSCIAAKRFIVVDTVLPQFERYAIEFMKTQKMGDPTDESVTVGPLARFDLRDQLHDQVKRSVAKGAKLLLGGEVPALKGAFYPPTILTNVKKGQPAFDEETFGPVAAIISVKDEEEAFRTANDSIYGLGAAVFTKDKDKGLKIASKKFDAGACFINAFVKSDPRLPFGGIKESGYGRELGIFGIREFVNIKTIYCEK